MTLWEMTEQERQLYALYADGEIDEQTYRDNLEAVDFDGNFDKKIESYCKVIANKQAHIGELAAKTVILRAEIDRINERKKGIEGEIKRMRGDMLNAMKTVEKDKVKTALFTVSIRHDTGVDYTDIPKLLQHTEYLKPYQPKESDLNKKAIKDALLQGLTVDGAELASGETLVIK